MSKESSIEMPSMLSDPPKRRREAHDDGNTAIKKKKTKRRKIATFGERNVSEDFDTENGLNNAIGKMDPLLLADFVDRQNRRHCPTVSDTVLFDMCIPASAFRDTSSWSLPRTTDNLPRFLREFGDIELQSTCEAHDSNGSPRIIVVTSAGLRAAGLARVLRCFQSPEFSVTKLFAKHIKLGDAIEQVKRTRMGVGIGTPARLNDLIDASALRVDKLKTILIDGSHVDEKRRGIFDMKDTYVPLMKLLDRREIEENYGNDRGKIQILVF